MTKKVEVVETREKNIKSEVFISEARYTEFMEKMLDKIVVISINRHKPYYIVLRYTEVPKLVGEAS